MKKRGAVSETRAAFGYDGGSTRTAQSVLKRLNVDNV
ncbi:hypothetical protein ABH945_002828 [Paraburkholderia sp. GAS333]